MIAPLLIPGAAMWSAWQPDRGMPFNSYFFETAAGNVAIDPLPLDAGSLQWLDERGGVATIVLTNRDHLRDTQALRERFGSRVLAHAPEAPLFGVPIDAAFSDGDEVFPGAFVIALPHGKTPGEVALHLPASHAAVVGDALIGAPAGALSLLADQKLEDPVRLCFSLRKLWALDLKTLLLCDGQPLFRGADDAIAALLESRAGAGINRINIDEIPFLARPRTGRFHFEDAEVGLPIGARKLGYRIARIAPGKAFSPMHSHQVNEEFFYVIEGTPAIRTPRGTLQCRPGDFIAFPVGERGTHQLANESATACLVLLVGGNDTREVCVYPDLQKILVLDGAGSRRIVRSVPLLDYFDGE